MVENSIQDDPEFSWWVSKVLRSQNRIISKLKCNHLRTTHKFGIRLLNTVEEALRSNKEEGNDSWDKALIK